MSSPKPRGFGLDKWKMIGYIATKNMTPKEILSPERKAGDGISQTISQYFASEEFRRSPKTKNSLDAYSHDLRRIFAEFCQREGISTLGELKPESIDSLISHIREGYAKATFNRRVACFRGFLNWAFMKNLLCENVAERLPGHIKVSSSLLSLNSEQEEALILETQKQKKKRDSALIQIALATGARVDEILKLNPRNIMIYSSGHASVRFHNQKKGAYREVPLDKDAARIIEEHIEEASLKADDPLFPRRSNRKEPLTRQYVWLMLKEYREKIGEPNLNPTMLRNTFVVNFQGSSQELVSFLGIQPQSAISLQRLSAKET